MSSRPDETKRAVIYTRVSTGPQAEGTSLEFQYAACAKKAGELGAQVVQACTDVESGAGYLSRDGLNRALATLEAGHADMLIIYDMSRYSRDIEHQQAIARRVARAGARLVFCTLDIGDPTTSADAALTFGMTGVFAQAERLKIRERTTNGRLQRARNGIMPSRAMSPYGLCIVNSLHVMDGLYPRELLGTYQIVEEQAQWVREMYRQVVEGASLQAVATGLDLAGVATPRSAPVWSPRSIHSILSNPVYKGTPQYGRLRALRDESRIQEGLKPRYRIRTSESERIQLQAPAIVSPETWERAQERLSENRRIFNSNPKFHYLLRSLLRCPQCDSRMTGFSEGGRSYYAKKTNPNIVLHRYYRCGKALNKATRCPYASFRADQVEGLVLGELFRVATDPASLRTYVEQAERESRRQAPQAGGVAIELEKLRRRRNALIDAQIKALEMGIPSAPYEQRLFELAPQITELEKALPEIEIPEPVAKRDWKAMSDAIRVVLESPDVSRAEKNGLLRLVISKIDLTLDGKAVCGVTLTFR